jgi:hypothetical protein
MDFVDEILFNLNGVFELIPNTFMIRFNHMVLVKAWIEFGIWHKQTQRGKMLEIKRYFPQR